MPDRCDYHVWEDVRTFPGSTGTRRMRCCRPSHDDPDHDLHWEHPDSQAQTWTPPSRRTKT